MSTQRNRLAIIIGGTTGMGRATAERMLERNVPVLIVGRNAERLAAVQAELGNSGAVETAQVDLYENSSVATFIADIRADMAGRN